MKFFRLGCCLLALAAFRSSASVRAADPAPEGEAKPVEVRNEVRTRGLIVALVPDGSRVKKGDELCEFDSDSLAEDLKDREDAVRAKRRDLASAETEGEVAAIEKRTVITTNEIML